MKRDKTRDRSSVRLVRSRWRDDEQVMVNNHSKKEFVGVLLSSAAGTPVPQPLAVDNGTSETNDPATGSPNR